MDKNLYTDEQLCVLANSGDTDAIDIIITRYKTLVRKISHSYFLVGGDKEDLAQEGIIGVFKAINDYDINNKTSFKSFAFLCIKRNILTAIKQSMRNKCKPLNNYISLTSGDENSPPTEIYISSEVIDPETEYINNESLTELEHNIVAELSGLEQKILALYLRGYSYQEIGERLEKSQKVIDNAMQRTRKKLERSLSKERR